MTVSRLARSVVFTAILTSFCLMACGEEEAILIVEEPTEDIPACEVIENTKSGQKHTIRWKLVVTDDTQGITLGSNRPNDQSLSSSTLPLDSDNGREFELTYEEQKLDGSMVLGMIEAMAGRKVRKEIEERIPTAERNEVRLFRVSLTSLSGKHKHRVSWDGIHQAPSKKEGLMLIETLKTFPTQMSATPILPGKTIRLVTQAWIKQGKSFSSGSIGGKKYMAVDGERLTFNDSHPAGFSLWFKTF